MALPRDPGVFIVSVQGVKDIESKKKRISEMPGVIGVEHNHVTQKLVVTYDGDQERVRDVEGELSMILRGTRRRVLGDQLGQ